MHAFGDMMENARHRVSKFGSRMTGGTAVFTRRVGNRSLHIARRIGPKRSVLGLVVLGAAIGGSIYLVRRLRARKESPVASPGEMRSEYAKRNYGQDEVRDAVTY